MRTDRVTANDRFKHANGSRTWGAIAAAALFHFAVLALWPAATPADLKAVEAAEIEVVAPPDVPIPPPPEDVAYPRTPVITVDAPDDVTIPPTVGEDALRIPPPPVRDGTGDIQPGDFVPITVRPRLLNGDGIARDVRRLYPRALRNAGFEATVLLWVKVDEGGQAVDARVKESSGYGEFDAVALELAGSMEFRPARNLDRPVTVWVEIPVAFRLR